jgi:hypothetical protein
MQTGSKMIANGDVLRFDGDAAFRDEYAETHARRETANRWGHPWIWVAIAPLVVLAGIAAGSGRPGGRRMLPGTAAGNRTQAQSGSGLRLSAAAGGQAHLDQHLRIACLGGLYLYTKFFVG